MLSLLIKRYRMENKMHFAIKGLLLSALLSSSAWAVEVATTPQVSAPQAQATQAVTSTPVQKPATAHTLANPMAQPATAMTIAASAGTVSTNEHGNTPADETKPLTAEQIAKQKAAAEAKVKALVKDQATRLEQLEKANLEALAQNQELQLKNDNLGVQVQVLQSERSAQMFLYGAATIAVGIFFGFLIASYIYTKRRRQW